MKRRLVSRAQARLPFGGTTIDFRCKRCGLLAQSPPRTKDGIHPLPKGWSLSGGSDCLCASCTDDVARGYPLDLRDLGRAV